MKNTFLNGGKPYRSGDVKYISLLTQRLASKDFLFIANNDESDKYFDSILEFDKRLDKASNWLYHKSITLYGDGDLLSKGLSKIASIETERKNLDESYEICKRMCDCFQFNAFRFTMLQGEAYLTVVDADLIPESEIAGLINEFQEINYHRLSIGGQKSLSVLGLKVLKMGQFNSLSGSLLFLTNDSKKERAINDILATVNLRSDTMLKNLKEIFGDWRNWAKMLVGFVPYKPMNLRQEVIIFNKKSNSITSSLNPRLAYEFGFSFDDLKL